MAGSWAFDDLFKTGPGAPDRPAVVSVGRERTETLTAGELARLSARLAAALRANGLGAGMPAAICGPNDADWIVCWLALARLGAVVVGLDDQYSPREVSEALAASDARVLIAARARLQALQELSPAPDIAMIALDRGAAPEGVVYWRDMLTDAEAPVAERGPDDAAVMLFTSGTTGKPKVFTLSCANIAANIAAVLDERILRPDDRVLLPLPLHHAYPLIVGFLTPVAGGAAVVLPQATTGGDIVRALAQTRANVMIGVPRLYLALAEGLESQMRRAGRPAAALFRGLAALAGLLRRRAGINAGRVLFAPLHRRFGGRLRIMVSGGARLEPAIVARLDALGFEVLSGYGLAETASLFTGNRPGAKRIGSEGLPLAGGEVRIHDPGADGTGEIQLKGPSVFAGYRDNPEANAEAFTADGWFRTGDLGRLDNDGYLYVTGRSKEVIVLGGGKKVFPEELEKRYGDHPAIAEMAVLERDGQLVGVVRPDVAALRAEAKTRPRDAARVAIADVARALPSYQRLAGMALVSRPLPRTRLGKYRRFQLPEIYDTARTGRARPADDGSMSAADRELVSDALGQKIWNLLKSRYAERGLAMDASPELDLGIDSLEWMTLSLELESRFGIEIDPETAAEITTVRELVRAAKAAKDGHGLGKEADKPAVSLDDPAWVEPPGRFVHALGVVLDALNRGLVRGLFGLSVDNRESLPPPGRAAVVVANHASDLDPAFLSAALPRPLAHRLWWGADAMRLFTGRLSRAFCRIAQVFPVDERRPKAAIELARRVLARGGALGWFPESWRTPTGELQRFLPGIGAVLAGTETTVVPACILGTFEVMPRTARLPRLRPVRVRFGTPVSAAELAAQGEGKNEAERIADALHRRVAALIEGAET